MKYHGTSDVFLSAIQKDGLRSALNTGVLCEKRKKNLDVVFLCEEKKYAEAYALRACLKHGGNPIILTIGQEGVLERLGRVRQWKTGYVPPSAILAVERVLSDENDVERMVTAFER